MDLFYFNNDFYILHLKVLTLHITCIPLFVYAIYFYFNVVDKHCTSIYTGRAQ